MIHIRPIEPHEWNLAKRLVYRVAHEVFQDIRPLEEAIAENEARGDLSDMDDIQASYFENGGIFLVITHDGEIICTGAIRRHAETVCELKRLWLLPDETSRQGAGVSNDSGIAWLRQKRGLSARQAGNPCRIPKTRFEFYKRFGFREVFIPNTSDDEDILMEMDL